MRTIEDIASSRYISDLELPERKRMDPSCYIDWAVFGAREAQKWFPIEDLTYEKTNGLKFIGKNKYGCISTARIGLNGIHADDLSVLPFTEWRPIERK